MHLMHVHQTRSRGLSIGLFVSWIHAPGQAAAWTVRKQKGLPRCDDECGPHLILKQGVSATKIYLDIMVGTKSCGKIEKLGISTLIHLNMIPKSARILTSRQ
jgi:hypothetical protein